MPLPEPLREVCRRYRVEGRVQGVGFRWFVEQQARALHLAGRVRNAVDGSVIVDVAGVADGVGMLEAALKTGPRGAIVDRLTVMLDGAAASSELGDLPLPFVIDR